MSTSLSIHFESHENPKSRDTKTITITGSPLFVNGFGLDRLGTDFLFRKPFAVSDLIEVVKYLAETQSPPLNGPLLMERGIAV